MKRIILFGDNLPEKYRETLSFPVHLSQAHYALIKELDGVIVEVWPGQAVFFRSTQWHQVTNCLDCTLATSSVVLTYNTLHNLVDNALYMSATGEQLGWFGACLFALYQELKNHHAATSLLPEKMAIDIAQTIQKLMKVSIGKKKGLSARCPYLTRTKMKSITSMYHHTLDMYDVDK